MEWLSHSQKKHCELCKTPFRFTKLYAHDMPKALPAYVFMSHMTKYIFKNMLVWLRAALVASVWLGWLPYLMRSIWSFLFWISDEGLGGGLFGRNGSVPGGTLDVFAPSSTGVCPSSPLFAATAAVTKVARAADQLPPGSLKLVNGTSNATVGSFDPILSSIIRLFFGTASTERHTSTIYSSSDSVVERVASSSTSHPSLLSDVGFLRNLTRNATLNRAIIAVLEGQIVTILVIVCFILIILVRDYVVQQQPEINMRAAFAAAENIPPQQPHQDAQVEQGPVVEPANAREMDELGERVYPVGEVESDEDNDLHHDDLPDLMDVDGPVNGTAQLTPYNLFHQDNAVFNHESQSHAFDESSSARGVSSSRSFPDEESSTANLVKFGGTTVNEYMQIYREADGDPTRILQIVEDRQLEDRLDFWVQLTRSQMDRVANIIDDNVETQSPLASTSGVRPDPRETSDADRSDGSDWVWADDHRSGSSSGSKGKGKLTEEDGEDDAAILVGSVSRPRANTDGPKISDTIHPLANNNWSFSDLPPEPPTLPGPGPPLFEPLFEQYYPDDRLPQPEADDVAEFPRPTGADGEAEVSSAGSTSGTAADDDESSASAQPPIIPSPPFAGPPQVAVGGPQEPIPAPRRTGGDAPPQPRQPVGLAGRVADFMWRDIDAIDPAELAIVEALNEFVDAGGDLGDDNQDEAMDAMIERDREVVEAAVAAGLDPEAIEDAEDLEGILELLGMRGPVMGLFQNAIFCTFLVSITIFLGIFVPYNIGRITVWTVANPMRPARMLFSLSKFVQDCALVAIGFASSVVSYSMQPVASLMNSKSLNEYLTTTVTSSWSMAVSAANRIGESFMSELPIISASEMRNFSAISHEALLVVKEHISLGLAAIGHAIMFIVGGDYLTKRDEVMVVAASVMAMAWNGLQAVPDILTNPSSWVINLSSPETATAINPELAYWNGTDRFWAIICGYIALSLVAGLYLRRGSPFSSGQTGQEWEASIIDGLNQASGVMKVILIIGIEMLVFPLYCGMLLDIALLPLFESTSMKSRLYFTVNYPVTSIFVHWFVGTGYMFHFALFVSMCRKIMRKGVLYFIRDPDDPEFHPVRDVLERNVTTQLRKIMFSAFVYGALVMVCLGGVVWGLALSLPTVLPIHYSSNEPVLEFPIDLLFYNFLMPLAVKFFKPSEGLHAMYTWWFRRCARALRITWFLFGERRVDEEGHLMLKPDSPHLDLPWWRRHFLELSGKETVPRTWRDIFEGGTAKPAESTVIEDLDKMNYLKTRLVDSGQLVPDGRFVRTPGSDQVKIPKGGRVFLEVDEHNSRQDGRADVPDADLYSTSQYQFVYVPPHFRARVSLFILLIWVFAAVTGVSITIVPLVFGRRLFQLLIPDNILTNDIYAFSIGIYVLGSAVYTLVHLGSIYAAAKTWLTAAVSSAVHGGAFQRVSGILLRVARVVFAYFFLLLAFPLLVTSLMELYAMIPLREFMYSGALSGGSEAASASKHTIRVIQSWTVGLLYMKLGARAITSFFGGTRLASAVRAVLRRGWLDPDLAILTRAFVIPGLALWLAAVSFPLLFAKVAISHGFAGPIMQYFGAGIAEDQPLNEAALILIHRLSFPIMAVGLLACITLWSMIGVFRSWKVRIRDEAYLIGERLHNFGVVNGPPRARGSWRGAGNRL